MTRTLRIIPSLAVLFVFFGFAGIYSQAQIVRTGHTDGVSAVALSPDGHLLASASMDQTIKIWDATSGKEILSISAEEAGNSPAYVMSSLAFSPDGKMLAVGVAKAISLLDPKSGKKIAELADEDLNGMVSSIAFSPDGKLLAAALGLKKNVVIWDLTKKTKLQTLAGASQPLSFGPKGTMLATSGDEDWIQVWNVASGKKTVSVKGPKEYHAVRSLSFNKTGTLLAALTYVLTGLGETKIQILNAVNGGSSKIQPITASSTGRFAPDGVNVVRDKTADLKNLIEILNPVNGKTVSSFPDDSSLGSLVSFSSDGRYYMFFEELSGPKVRVLDTATKKFTPMVLGFSTSIASAEFSSDSKKIIAGYEDGQVVRWDVGSGKPEKYVIPTSEGKPVESYLLDTPEISPGAGHFMRGGFRVYDSSTGENISNDELDLPESTRYSFTPDGKGLLAISKETISVIDPVSGRAKFRMLRPTSGDEDEEASVAASYDNKILAIASGKKISFWDLVTGSRIKELPPLEEDAKVIRFSANGNYFAYSTGGGIESTIHVLRYVSQEEVRSIDAAKNGFAFSPDSSTIATIDTDGSLVLTPLGEPDAEPLVSDESADADVIGDDVGIIFSPDGKMAAIHGNKGLTIFNAKTGELIRKLK